MNQEETRIQNLENEVKLLKIEIAYLKRILGVEREMKDSIAWEKLERVGRKISNSWKSDKQSWQLISEERR
ncbi:MAG: hypothetical protein HXS48_10190 [Theionarchaea archaeon]|nr:MAG: hypothetical protein AYK19_10915 [Theionarchaea archaeon DG-70-1]MBU7027297.1 hypothetical protein [Theionarchaea archaeon]